MTQTVCVGLGTGSQTELDARKAAIVAMAATWGGEEEACS